jgi:transcriptional regulator with XRE-family HTH domain
MEDPVMQLRERVGSSSQASVAEEMGVSQQYLSAVLTRRKAPGKSILNALGLERLIIYVRAGAAKRGRAGGR